MKKNITINLFGQLYNIDEDAYELLNNYEESLREHLRRQADGNEIFNDIETRIAELLSELKAQGTEAVSIEHIQNIVSRIGKPEEIGADDSPLSETTGEAEGTNAEETANSQADDARKGAPKRLYRDVENKMISGVLAGLAKYYGGDVTWWRLGFVFACILWLLIVGPIFYNPSHLLRTFFVPLYFILAIVVPAAETPADRLKMKGEEVNPQTLADEVTDEARRKEEQRRSEEEPPSNNVGSKVKRYLMGFITVLFGLVQMAFILAGVLLLIPCGFILFGLALFFINPNYCLQVYLPFSLNETVAVMQNPGLGWLFGLSAFVVCFIPAYAAIHSLMSKAGKMQPMGTAQRTLWLILWGAAAGVLTFASKQMVEKFQQVTNEEYQSHLYKQEGIDYAFYFPDEEDLAFYRDNRWLLLEAKIQRAQHSDKGEYYTGDRNHRYLNGFENHQSRDLMFRAERTDTVAPGRYRLTSAARADNWGAYIYVRTSVMREKVGIEPFGNEFGGIWHEANSLLAKMDEAQRTSTEEGRRLTRIVNAHDGNGYGWSKHYIHHIEVGPDSLVTYGVLANAALSISEENKLHWFSATDFELTREK